MHKNLGKIENKIVKQETSSIMKKRRVLESTREIMLKAMKKPQLIIDEELIKQIEKEELENQFKRNIAKRISNHLGLKEFKTSD